MDTGKKKSLTENPENNSNKPAENIAGPKKSVYWKSGITEAGKLGGSIEGLKVSLHKLYQDYKKEMRDNTTIQDEKKDQYQAKIDNLNAEISQLEGRIEKNKTERITELKKDNQQLKDEISEAKNNPKTITGDEEGKLTFFVSGGILLFLTVYLIVFYSSASYSAFFKQFTMSRLGIASSIFDPKAISNALSDGITELILILTIPFVFLGLGFLIHTFMQLKGIKKFLNTGFFLVITFIFDFILAYEITEKIYELKRGDLFDPSSIPDYSVGLAFGNVSFWLIIFAGFIVYLIWGFVFEIFSKAFSKKDKLKVFILEKEKNITDHQNEIKQIENENEKLNNEILEKKKEINNFGIFVEGKLIPMEDIKAYLNDFFLGWLKWMEDVEKAEEERKAAATLYEAFVLDKFSSKTQK